MLTMMLTMMLAMMLAMMKIGMAILVVVVCEGEEEEMRKVRHPLSHHSNV